MEISERAQQLLTDLFKKCYSGSEAKSFRHALRREFTPMLISWAESLMTDSANLARGVAIEQAARLAQEVSAYNIINREYDSARSIVQEIRSLASTDAAQALAAHDAELRATMTEQFQSYTTEHAAAHDAEIERKFYRGKPPATQQNNTEPPVCEKHAEKMILCFYDRPGNPPGNGWSCQSCAKECGPAPAKEGEK